MPSEGVIRLIERFDAMDTPHLFQMPINVCPPGWRTHRHQFTVGVAADHARVWHWLNTPETFTQGQLPPYRVEFVSPDPERIPADFSEGVFNIHHGPLLNFAGVLTEIRPGAYRDLQYFYGSYALSLRLIRPARLQFWVEEMMPGVTCVRGQVDSYVHPWMYRLWTWAQQAFWWQFGRLMQRGLEREAAQQLRLMAPQPEPHPDQPQPQVKSNPLPEVPLPQEEKAEMISSESDHHATQVDEQQASPQIPGKARQVIAH
jgi:hypothetical protein